MPFIRWLETRASADRAACLKAFIDRSWTLGRRRWDTTNVVHLMASDRWFSINAFFDALTGSHVLWYINFERPYVRTPDGVDTLDLLLDLVVLPDLSWEWKDQDEYDHARRTGAITTNDAAGVDHARDQALALVERGGAPFTSDWPAWRPSERWSTPTLPADQNMP